MVEERRKNRVWIQVILIVVFITSGECGPASDAMASIGSSVIIKMVAATMEYANPVYMAPGSFMKVYRKTRDSPPSLNGFLPFVKDLPPNTNVHYTAYQKLSNKWQETFIKMVADLCQSLQYGLKIEKAVFAATDLPKKCPVPKGNYTMSNYTIDSRNLPAFIPVEEVRVRSWWTTGETNIIIYSFDTKTEKKKEHRGKKGSHSSHHKS